MNTFDKSVNEIRRALLREHRAGVDVGELLVHAVTAAQKELSGEYRFITDNQRDFPKTIEEIAPGDTVPVDIDITPSDKAIAGDYVMNVSASGDGASDSASFRVTVLTSTLWGIAGLLVIAAAVLVLAGAVTRYGRR